MRRQTFGAGGPPLVFVHGWCGDGGFWSEQIVPFAATHLVVVVELDLAGAAETGFSLAEAGARLAEAAGGLDGELTLVGHSMGGAIILEAAVALAARRPRLIGVDTFTDAGFYRRLAPAVIAARLAPFAQNFPAALRAMIDRITLAGGPALRRRIAGAMLRPRQEDALAALAALLAWDIEALWPKRARAAAINSRPLAAACERIDLPGLDECLMDEVGHFPMLEAPERFNACLRECLAGSAAS
jgi:pimeloyl-ACP methyl ester carboxylesterase